MVTKIRSNIHPIRLQNRPKKWITPEIREIIRVPMESNHEKFLEKQVNSLVIVLLNNCSVLPLDYWIWRYDCEDSFYAFS